jgi:hypothetical protein
LPRSQQHGEVFGIIEDKTEKHTVVLSQLISPYPFWQPFYGKKIQKKN